MIKIYPFYVNSSKNVLLLLPPQLTERFPSVMPLGSHLYPTPDHHWAVFSHRFVFSRISYTLCNILNLISFIYHNSFEIHSVVSVFLIVVYSFTCWWTLRLFPVWIVCLLWVNLLWTFTEKLWMPMFSLLL